MLHLQAQPDVMFICSQLLELGGDRSPGEVILVGDPVPAMPYAPIITLYPPHDQHAGFCLILLLARVSHTAGLFDLCMLSLGSVPGAGQLQGLYQGSPRST